MAWTVTINGETFNDTDFQPFSYPVNFPRIFQAVADGFSAVEETVAGVYGVSVLDYYDAADGIDYAITLRRALAAGEKAISFPAGNFQFRSQDPIGVGYAVHFRDKTGVLIRGAAGGGTTITIGSSANVGAFNFASCTDCEIADLVIDCARQNQTTTANVHGVRCADLTRSRMRRVTIKDSVGYGLGLQAGSFIYNLFEDITISSSGGDGVDIKNNASGNIGNIFTRLRVSDWRRLNPADAKAAFDTRGGVRITDSTFYLTEVSGYAANTPFLRFRPDEQASLTFVSATGPVVNNSFFTGSSSGATGVINGSSTNASSATVVVRGVDGVFITNEPLVFDNGTTARFASAAYTVFTGGRDPMAINCRAYGPSGNTSVGIGFVTSQTGSMLVNCVSRNLRDGFKTSGSTSYVTIDNCYAQFCNTGFYLEADDTRISNCTSEESVSEGTYLFGQRNSFRGLRGFRDNVGFRKQGTALETALIDVSYTSTSTQFAGSYTAGTFSAFDVPGLTNAFELNNHAVVGASGKRVGFFGSNGSTLNTPRGVSNSRAMQTLFSAIEEYNLVGNGIVNGVVTGSPETVVSGNVGDTANRLDMGGHWYYKQFGSSGTTGTTTGWVPFIRGIAPGTLIAPNFLDPRLTFSRAQASSATSIIAGSDGVTIREYGENEPRFQGRTGRFVFEGASQNLNTNPRGSTATAGTLPAGWSNSGNVVTRTVVGPRTLNGIPGFELRFAGTPSGTGAQSLAFSVADTVASGTVVCNQLYVALTGGTLTNVTGIQLRCASESGGTVFTPNATPQLVQNVRQITGTASQTSFRWNYADTVTPVDWTFFVGVPMREHAAFPSTPTLPPVDTISTSVRSGDSLFASTEIFDVASNGACTVVGSFVLPYTSVSASVAQTLFEINDGTANNRYFIRNDASTATATLYRVTGGATSSVSLGTITAGVLFRVAMTIDGAGRAAASLNGSTVQAVTGGPTSGLTVFRIGNNSSGSSPMFGRVQSLRFLNYGVTDAELAPLLANIG